MLVNLQSLVHYLRMLKQAVFAPCKVALILYSIGVLGPVYMSRAGPVSRFV